MHLDITLPNGSVVATIFEFTPEGDMRLQIVGTNPGEPRPPRFNNATLLTKTATKASENGDDFTAIESTVRQWLATNGGVPVPVSISPIHIVGDYAWQPISLARGADRFC
ncbi:MAG: hypothetical protein HC925_04415 [Coleofasciculaceae cyanobacterium SM2_3_26]|nr:hypothetical protein [Coleofasciculaceae cyanobacterium SM2_3_26]